MVSFRYVWLYLLLLPAQLWASGHVEKSVVLVIDSRQLTGWESWWANVYNESHFLFALITVLIILTLGLMMGELTELIMRRIGINLKSRVLAEH